MIFTPSILITDDDRDYRETLADVFMSRGYNTLLARDGEEAVDIVASKQVHILLLDMHMPRLSGLDTVRRVRSIQSPPPCILMSAALTEDIQAQADALQLYAVRSKPMRFADITNLVSGALQSVYDWRP